MKSIVVITLGDSNDMRCWSNVPYLLCSTLVKKGIQVHRINANVDNKYVNYITKIIGKVYRHLFKLHDYSGERSAFYRTFQNLKLKRELAKYPDSDVVLSLCFNLPIKKYTDIYTILYGDWNYEYLVEKIKREKPSKIEQKYIKYENGIISEANMIVGMFRGATKYFENKRYNPNIVFLGNTINTEFIMPENRIEELVKRKFNSRYYLFIGTQKYYDSALEIAKQIQSRNQLGKEKYSLHIIGMSKELFPQCLYDVIECHGYLNKSVEEEKKRYYELLLNARFLINTSKGWAGFNSLVEGMLYYTPLIISEFEDFSISFSNVESFCYCVNEGKSLSDIFHVIDEITEERYFTMAKQAHKNVENWNWNTFTDNLITVLDGGTYDN